MRLGTTIALRVKQLDFSFTEPYFLDRNMAAGIDAFAITRNQQTQSQFDQQSIGGDFRVGYQITEALRQTLKYTLRTDNIFNVASTASLFIKQEAGQRVTSSVGQVLLYDKRDNPRDPTEGYYVQLASDGAGLGGDVKYVRNVVTGGYFFPLAPQWVLSVLGEAGDIFGINDAVRIEDRFFVGGDNLRGFATAGIGPRDQKTGDALGGRAYYTGTVQLGFPLGLPQELGITGRVFTDVGSLFSSVASGAGVEGGGAASLRVSSGIGVSWASPLGPIRLDLGKPLVKEKFDKKELFRISFGTRF